MKVIITLIGLLSSWSVWAQQPNHGEKVVFPSPQAAQLGKFGGYTLNHSTGAPNLSIPLHTVKEGTLQLPLSLTYFYAGCRPADEPSWTGLGWSLSAGGVITRIIKGIADETPNQGYLSRRSLIASTVNGQVPSQAAYQNLLLQSGANDAQPDLFSFQFNGYSGKFVFGSDGLPKLLSSDNLKITYTTAPDNIHNNGTTIINSWTITAENGTQYEFAKYEFSGGVNSDNIYMPSAWYVSKITSTDGDVINLSYSSPQPYHSQRRRQVGLSDQETYQNSNNTVISSNTTALTSSNYSEEIYLTEIRGTLWRVLFDSESYTQTLNFNETRQARKLNSIRFFSPIDSSTPIKQFNLSYNLTSYPNNKLMLLALAEPNVNPFTFDYHSQVPAHFDGTSRMVDYWGFYNGQSNLSLIPGRQGSDLEPRLEQTKMGSLVKITYPTGGSTDLIYESNQYSYVQDQITAQSTYLISDRSYSWYRNVQGVYVNHPSNTITLTRPTRLDIQLINSSTGQGPMGCSASSNFVSITLPAGNYSGNAILQNTQVSFYPCSSSDSWNREGVNFTLNVKIYEPITRYVSAYGGLRVKEMTDTPTGSAPAITTRYFYNRDTSDTLSSGVIAQEPFYTFNPTNMANGSANFGFYRSSPFNPESMLPLYYKEVREENNQFKTYYSFTSHVQQKDEFGRWAFFVDQGQNSFLVNATSILKIGDVQSGYYMRSLPLSVVVRDLNGNKKQETQYTYQGFYNNVVQIPALYNEYLTSYEVPGQNATTPFRLYYNKAYYVIGGWPRKTSETTTVYKSN